MTRLSEIEARGAKATPGPWTSVFYDGSPAGWHLGSDRIETLADFGDAESARLDVEFVAHAREDIPYLLGRLRETQEALRWIAANCHEPAAQEIADEALAALEKP